MVNINDPTDQQIRDAHLEDSLECPCCGAVVNLMFDTYGNTLTDADRALMLKLMRQPGLALHAIEEAEACTRRFRDNGGGIVRPEED